MFKNSGLSILLATVLVGTAAWAKAPASAPAGTTGVCKDGSYTSATSKSGACSGHDGVKKWYGAAADASTPADAGTADKGASTGKTKKSSDSSAAAASSTASAGGAATGVCKDGSTTTATSKSGACSGHGGVKDWYAGGAMSAAAATAAAPSSKSAATASSAAPPAAGAATGTCKDGTSTSAASKSGACSGHGGVKDWYASSAAAPAAGAGAAAASGGSMSKASSAPAAKSDSYTRPANPAPGGGPGLVWANTNSKVYHCQNDEWYGRTKEGAYMSEANAVAKGYRPDSGKACAH